ncbi:MAG: hypothetical protein WC466_08975 [Candidatus Izemoplasmatales bacterium]
MDVIRNIIRKQINLFFESFDSDNDKKTYVPPNDVAQIAKLALDSAIIAEKNGIKVKSLDEKGNQGSGRTKAKKLSEKTPQNFSEMKRLKAFFDSNAKTVEGERKKHGIIQARRGTSHEMSLSVVLLIWNLHGGDVCKNWVDSQLSDTHNQSIKKKERLRSAGGAYKNNGMGVFKTQYDPSQQRIHR